MSIDLGRRFNHLYERTKPIAEPREISRIRKELRKAPDSDWIPLTEVPGSPRVSVDYTTLWTWLHDERGPYRQFELRKASEFGLLGGRKHSPSTNFVHKSLIEELGKKLEFERFLEEHFYSTPEAAAKLGLTTKEGVAAHLKNGFPHVVVERNGKLKRYVPKFVVNPAGEAAPLSPNVLENWLVWRGTLDASVRRHSADREYRLYAELPAVPEANAWKLHDWLKYRGLVSERQFVVVDGTEMLAFPAHVAPGGKPIPLNRFLRENAKSFTDYLKGKRKKLE